MSTESASATPVLGRLGAVPVERPLSETSLSFAARFRHSLIGLALGVLALLAAVALGVWIASAIFHTAPGALA